MNKAEFIERIAAKAETTKAAAARIVDAIFDAGSGAIAEAVQTGKKVSIPGFGKFQAKKRAARKGRNPRTGANIDIPESTVVSFSAGKVLKDRVGGKPAQRRKASGGPKAGGKAATGIAPEKEGAAAGGSKGTASTRAAPVKQRSTTGGAKGGSGTRATPVKQRSTAGESQVGSSTRATPVKQRSAAGGSKGTTSIRGTSAKPRSAAAGRTTGESRGSSGGADSGPGATAAKGGGRT